MNLIKVWLLYDFNIRYNLAFYLKKVCVDKCVLNVQAATPHDVTVSAHLRQMFNVSLIYFS